MDSIGRFLHPAPSSFFLLGPRGTGKTTWTRQQFPDALVVNLLQPETYRELVARPERLRELVLGNTDRRDIVIDEVQRAPELLHVVHDLLERPNPPRFVLTGSSARKLRHGDVNLLAGRATMRTMHPFMAAELPAFDLTSSLKTGLIPLVVSARDSADTLAAYAATYVEQEVRAEGLVRQVGDFARFLEVVSFSHGAVINISNVARETAVHRKSIEGYLGVLEDLLLAFRLPVFTKRASRATVAHPKFYFFDAGVFRSLRPTGPLDRPAEIDGAALEGLVAQHLRAWIAYSGVALDLCYWRTRTGLEVDFVVYGSTDFFAIEVKNSDRVRPDDLKGLRAFAGEYPECRPLLLYRGVDRLEIGGIPCWPVEQFLARLRPGHSPLA
ncbi:MAG: ATP-binding protein [Gemmatimonadaceae bacterium]|nr:ATP-binding protein [Gemmatimonadaceae bacterium]